MRTKILPAGVLFLLLTGSAFAQVTLSLQGPAQAVNCDSLTLTSRVENSGATVANLWLTNQLPPSGYYYVLGASTVYLPGGVVVTGAAANPVNNSGGTNLGWDFSAVVTPSLATNLLITEVFYDPTNAVEDAYEWIEIYNPSTNTFAITNWSIRDAVPGSVDVLPPMTLVPGTFAIVAASTSAFYSVHPAYPGLVVQVSDGLLGSGLNNGPGDGVFLRDAASNNVDAMSYGGSTAAFNPPVPFAPQGYSLVRNPANNDSNTRNDWSSTNTPNPGSGSVPVGLQNGGVITVVWKAEVSCEAVSGQFLSYATFEQPPGAKGTSTVSKFVTISRPDLVVTKTPTLQEGGYGDFVSWTVRVENAGFGAAPNVTLTDNLGPGLLFQSFSVNPTNGVVGSNVTWDATVIPAFTSLNAGAYVDIVVTAQLVACQGLFNSADATWRCAGLLAATNAVCENTANNGQTATATLQFNDRHPALSGSLSLTNLLVPYCGNLNVTLYLTNATGPDVGSAVNIELFSSMPDGWSYSVPTNIGVLLPGQSTSVVVTVTAGGTCPMSTEPDAVFFYPYYFDGCDHFFYGPVLFSPARVVNPPAASVIKQMPASAYTTFPVTVRFSYTNFSGGEVVVLTDVFPKNTNLSVANISPAGSLTSTTVVWTLSGMSGSGVRTTSFDMVYGNACGGPNTLAFNTISASSYTDCRGCVRPVAGSGANVPIRLVPGPSCPFNGGTNGSGGSCFFYGVKLVSTGLTEACTAVTLTHTFTNFGGVDLTNWTGVVFSSDLAGGQGVLGSTASVQVVVNGSNLTSAVSITQTNPSLVVALAGLNNTIYSNLTLVTNGLSISWTVSAPPGQMVDASTLLVPPCGESTEWASWDVGASSLSIALEKILVAEACGVEYGRIELNMSANPRFPVYDAEVVLDLDADTNLLSSFEFVTNSTAYTGLYNLSGTPLTPSNPAVSGSRLTWTLGDLRTNGQTMVITYRLRASCDAESNGQMRAFVRYNTRCSDGTMPPVSSAHSATNDNPFFFTALLDNAIEPELTFLVSTQYVVRLDFLNSGFGSVYNLRAEMLLPPNVVFGGAAIAPSFISTTNVVWDFQIASPFPGLTDRDGDGFYDDLLFSSPFSFWVTNYLTDCTGGSGISLVSSHGCGGSVCAVAAVDTATFTSSKGALVTRATFPDTETLCATNEVIYSVRNSGLTMDYNVQAYQTLPLGMTYVPGSSQVSLNNGPTNSIADPPGDGSSTNPLTWTSAEIPSLIALNPNDQVTILYNVFLGCEASMGDDQFISNGRFTDNCGLVQSNRDVISVLAVNEPLLQVNKSSLLVAADLNVTNVYTIVVSHDALSAADVPSMELVDVLPAAITFLGASPVPDAVIGQTLIWSNNTLMSLVGDGVAPFTIAESSITIVVTGRVNDCAVSVINDATVNYGCSVSNLCMTAHDDVSLITDPVLSPPGLLASMQLNTCGGTKTVSVTNRGATANGMVMTETAPPGYVFVSASVTGEFNSAALNLVLSGIPLGRTGTVNFTTAAASGATDVDDDRGDGLANLDFGYNNGYIITYVLASDGTELDCLADPTDLDFTDPEQGDPTSRSSSNVLTYTNLCGEAGSVNGSVSAYPDIPDPDIDLQPNSLIVTNGQVLTNITATIRNNAESGLAENLHVRLRFGMGWTNVALVSSNIVSSGTTNMLVEIQGSTNVLVDLPGVILDPVDDLVVLVFRATVTTNGGFLDVVGEVVGDCDDGAVSPACVFTNTLGLPPLADTMSGVIPAVNGQYYAFDQDRFVAAGLSIAKTVRYDDESPAAAGLTRTARVGEDLIYRIEATYFGGIFSNVTITESLPAQLFFRDPASYAFSGAITGAVYNPGTGVFTLQPAVWSINPSTFAVDIPVVVSNRADVQNGVVITNVIVTDYFLDGATNDPMPRYTEVTVLEPALVLTKSVNSNLVQSGDIIIFTNRLTHAGLSATSAYSIVFTDTLPYGLTFSGLSLTSDGMDNDGDAVIDEADEGTLVSGSTFTVTTNQNAFLGELAISNTVFFRFPVLVTNQIIGATMINTSRVTWTSLDGVATNLNERDGSGGVNDYTNSATASLASKAIGGITKSFISSTQTNTLDGVTNVFTIGERMVYDIRVDLPQGIATNVNITDFVAPGMDWVGGNTNAGLAYAGYGYFFTVPAGGPQFPTTTVAGLVITDTDPTPNTSTNVDGSGSNIVFRFGAITNTPDGDSANDYFVLSMEFVILNHATNDGVLPGIYTNRNRAEVRDAYTVRGITGAVYTIAEHDLTLTKLFDTTYVDASNLVTVTLIVSNRPQALANAYDIRVEDFLTNTLFDTDTINVTNIPDGWAYSTSSVVGGMWYNLFTTNTTALAPGASVTNQFTIRIAQNVAPNRIYTNRANVTLSDTIYGDPPGDIPFRSDTTNATRTIQVTNFIIAKALFATSETNLPPDSTNTFVQFGERLTYRVDVTLPETTITNLSIFDVMPSNGLAYIRNSARVDTNALVGFLPSISETPTGSGLLATNGQNITFNFFGNTVVYGDNNTGNNSFSLYLDVIALNTNVSTGLPGAQTIHTNRARVTYAANPVGAVTSAVVTTTMIEPRLVITKNIVQVNADAGDVVNIQLTVTNSGLATAYDVSITDVLNTVYFDPSTVVFTNVPTGFVSSVIGNAVIFSSDTNSPTGTNTIEVGEFLQFAFDVTISSNIPPLLTTTNIASLAWDSLNSTNIFAVQRTYTTNATDTISGQSWSFSKSFIGTSEINVPPDSITTNVQIGEVVTYQLDMTLPEGTVSNLTFRDFVPTGMAFIVGSVVVDTSSFSGTLSAVTNVIPGSGSLGTNGGSVTVAFLGNTVVAGDNSAANNTLKLRLSAVVLDTNTVSGLVPQSRLTNRADVTYFNNPLSPSNALPVVVQAVEPRIFINKNIIQTNADAGDTVDVSLVISNNGTATAYDLQIADPLNTSYFDPSSVTNVYSPTGFVMSASNNAFYIRSDANAPTGTNTLEIGESLSFTVRVTVAQSVPPNGLVTNRVFLTADSLANTNLYAVQRPYSATGSDTLAVDNFLTLTKILYSTSETGPADSTNDLVQIGEVVTYELETALPESTISNLVFTDVLPAGMAFVVGSVVVDTSSFNGTLAGVTNIAPNTPPLGADGQDITIQFSGNSVVVNDNIGTNNSLRIRLSAIVLNTNSNSGLVPQTVLTNTANVTYTGNPQGPVVSSNLLVRVIEPVVDLAKDIDLASGDAGDRAIITLTLTNSGLGTAYDLSVTDAVSAAMFSIASISNVTVPSGFTFAVVTNGVNAAVIYSSDPASGQPTNTLEVSESIVFRFAADLAQSVEPGAMLTNYARVASADTIYGTNIFAIARDKSGSNANDRVAISNMIIVKAFTGTSENGPVDTTGTNVTIGEWASYRLTVTLPEATITNLSVNDLLPAGMACITSSVSVDMTGFGGSLPAAPTVTGNVTFVFAGLTVVSNNNNGTDNAFSILFNATARNIAGNDGLPSAIDGTGQMVLSNRAVVYYGGNPPASTTAFVNVQVVEPSLTITKQMTGPSNGLVNLSIVVSNRGPSTAFDVIVQDTFPSNWWDTATIMALSIPTGFVYAVTNAPADGYLTIRSDTNTFQPTNSIEPGESLVFLFNGQLKPGLGTRITNIASVAQYTTIDGSNVNERFEPQTNAVALLNPPRYGLVKTLLSPSGRSAAVGENVQFSIVVTNSGGMGLNPVGLVDTFDTTYLGFASGIPAPSVGAGTLTWTNVGTLAIGATTSLVVNFTALVSTLPGDTTNRVVANVFSTNGLPLLPQTSAAPVKITTVGYTLAKTWTSPTNRAAQVGEAVQFSVTIVNTGEEALVAVPVADVYETNYLSYVGSVPPTVDNTNDGAISWTNIGPLPVGASTSLWLNFTARTRSQSLPRTNTVVASPTTPPGTPGVPVYTSPAPYKISSAGYTLTKTRTSPADRAAQVGETVTFDITINNTGDVQLVSVPVTDVYESGYLSFVSSVPAPTLPFPGAILWSNIGPLPAGASTSIVATFTAITSSQSIDHTNTVSTTPTTPTNEPPVFPATNRAPYDISSVGMLMEKVLVAPTNRPAIVGEPVVFRISIANTGDVPFVTVPVADYNFSPYLAFTSATPPANSNDTTTVYWNNIGSVAAGASTSILVTFTAIVPTPDTRTNFASGLPTLPPGEPPNPRDEVRREFDVDAPARLGDFVWNDLDADGIQDGGETGVANVAVTLYDFDGLVVGVTTTGVNGAYAFTNLIPAMYFVGMAVPGGYSVSPQNQGGDDALDSDINTLSGQTGLYTLNAGQTNLTIDAGLYQTTALGDYVWEDVNGNGVQDGGELPLTNVTVRLYDALTNMLTTTATDATGFYQFANLVPGVYFVEFVAPAGYQFTRQDVGADTADSDANPATGRTLLTTLISGEYDPTWDAGLYRPAGLGNFIWHDLNADGIQDGGETGVTDVIVTLFLTNGTWVATVTTGVSGAYAFTNLPPDDYFVQVLPTAGMEFSPRDQGGDDAVDSDANVITGESGPVNLISDENDPTIDAGLFERASLGDYVWLDVNGDGVQSGGSETGLPGVVVTLFNATTNVMGVATTAVDGVYAFMNLVPATYFVGFALPGGYQFTRQDIGLDIADSDADRTTGWTIPTVLISGENDLTWDAGMYLPASLGNFIWHDLNADGIQDSGETGVANVVVTLYDTNNVIVGVTTTSVTGVYAFTNLSPQGYSIAATIPAGYTVSPQDQGGDDAADSDINTATGRSAVTNLASGDVNLTLDGGLYLPASLGDFVWEDLDRNGVQNAGEPAVPNVTVRLYDAQTNLLLSATTDASGLYAFTNLVPGVYFVEFAPALGYDFTLADQGLDVADSDANPATGRTMPTTLISGENDMTWDAGLTRPASLGDFVWQDLNADGIWNTGEPGISNVTVWLYDAGTNLLATTTTDTNGLYSFTNLLPGTYLVQFVLPAGYNFSPANQGVDTTDSDAGSDGFAPAVTLISGEVNSTLDAGMYRLVELGDRVWVDDNGNGIQDAGEFGIAGVTVTLYNASGVVTSQLTGAFGTYLFTNLAPATYSINVSLPVDFRFTLRDQGANDAADSDVDPGTGDSGNYVLISGQPELTVDAGVYQPASIGDRLWEDLNYNAIQDTNELYSAAVTGIVVSLYASNGILYATTTTDTNGYYLFGDLPPGGYFVEFVCPTTHVFVLADQGTNDTVDSDADRVTGRTTATFLSSGENDTTWDAGIIGSGLIGDRVWIDLNQNGVHDENLAIQGLNGVRVYLYRISGGVTSWVATAVTATHTDGGRGYYEFAALPFGDYRVFVALVDIPPNLTIRTTPLSYIRSLRPNYIYRDVDFGFNGPPTPVELSLFTARRTDAGVLVHWETAVELENLGFNVYRSDSETGARTKVNANLISGLGGAAGQAYDLLDATAQAGATYYYWLEDVSWDFRTKMHGPAVVVGDGAEPQAGSVLGSFSVSEKMGLYRIRGSALSAAGVPVLITDPAKLQVVIGEQEVAAFVSASEAPIRPTDYILFWAPATNVERSVELRVGETALRMEEIYTAPFDGEGNVCYGLANEKAFVEFGTADECLRYILLGFPEEQVFVLDVTDVAKPKLLFGGAWLGVGAESGLYFSYAPEQPAHCVAVGVSGVVDVETIVTR